MRSRYIRCALVAAIATATAAPPLGAQQTASDGRPVVGQLTITHPAGAHREVLANGVILVTLPFGPTPKAEIRVVVDTRNDPVSNARLRTLLPTLWRAGSTGITGEILADSLEKIGGALSVSASPGGVTISLDVLSSALAAGVGLVSEMVQHPRLDVALLEPANGRRGRRGGGDGGAVQTFENALFDGPAAPDSVSALPDLEALKRLYADNVVPARTTIYVTGRFDDAIARRTVATTFATWRAAASATTSARTAPRAPDARSTPALLVSHRPGARQSTIIVGARVAPPTDSAFARFRVVDAVLGGSLSSRISMNIREAKGYVYSPASRLVALNAANAYWAEVVEVAANVTWPTLREILREVAGIDSTPPSVVEVSSSARFVVGSALMRRASRSGWADEVEDSRALGETWGDWDGSLRVAQSTTPAQVRTLVGRYLGPRQLTVTLEADTVALGDQMAAIRRALEPSGTRPSR